MCKHCKTTIHTDEAERVESDFGTDTGLCYACAKERWRLDEEIADEARLAAQNRTDNTPTRGID